MLIIYAYNMIVAKVAIMKILLEQFKDDVTETK